MIWTVSTTPTASSSAKSQRHAHNSKPGARIEMREAGGCWNTGHLGVWISRRGHFGVWKLGSQEFRWNSTGIKQIKVEILYITLHFVLIYRTTYLSLLSLLFLHLFKPVSHLQSVYSRTLLLAYNFK